MRWMGKAAALTVMAIVFAGALPANADGLFTAQSVPVDVTAQTAAAARDVALLEGQRQALQQVLRRLTLRQDHDRLPSVDDQLLVNMVANIQVANERTSATRYLAELTVTFHGDSVRSLLRQYDLPFTETRAKPTLVLPVLESDGVLRLFDDDNRWRDAWSRLDLKRDAMFPLVLPLGDLTDLSAIGPSQAAVADPEALQRIRARYGMENVLVAHARLTPSAAGQAAGAVDVTLQRLGPLGEGTEVESLVAAPDEDAAALLQRAAAVVAARLEETWKQQTAVRDQEEDRLSALVEFSSLAEWLQVRERLRGNAFVARVDVAAITRRDAQVVLHYRGRRDQLAVSLAQTDLRLIERDGYWRLSIRPGAEPADR